MSTAFATLIREILDWRLAQYLSRGQFTDVVCSVSRNSGGNPILFLPSSNNGAGLPKGPLDVVVDGRPMKAVIAKIAVNVVHEPGNSKNELLDILHGWFGDEAGRPGRGDRVRFHKKENTIVMEAFGPNAESTYGAKVWERYSREKIPQEFGLVFNHAISNVGFVVSEPHVFLLVTLEKDDMNPGHRYTDHFLSDEEFIWQSQNRTSQKSKHGQIIKNHHTIGIHVQLFVRPTKRIGQAPASFVYCGEVDFVSWEGDTPITVRWRLREPVPRSHWAALKIPA